VTQVFKTCGDVLMQHLKDQKKAGRRTTAAVFMGRGLWEDAVLGVFGGGLMARTAELMATELETSPVQMCKDVNPESLAVGRAICPFPFSFFYADAAF